MKKCPKCGREYEDANTLCPSDGTVLKKEGDDLIGRTLIGKYRIEEKLSEGGMGAVYRGTHVLMEKTVAVKVLHPALAADDKIVARFTREAKAASRITHPHALVVTDFGEDEEGVVFLVMEYLRGRTLKQIVRHDGPMTLVRAAEIVRQVAGALDAAHSEGVVHRDLKSDNIMLEESQGGGDWAKVLDFGIAKIIEPEGSIDPELTAPNLIIGTPQYMSPEQCGQASEIDTRSDIYSLGIIVYEMLAGHVPFTGDSPTAIMMKHIQEPPPSLLEERDDLPASVARNVERALAKRPEDRFQTAGALAEALAQSALEKPAAATTAATAAGLASHTDGQTPPGTNRIVVTTGENVPVRATTNEEYEEATVVSARRPRPETSEYESRPAPPPPPPPAAGFNPWKIALPAIAALVIAFGAFYVFRADDSTPDDGTPPLVADPNSQPVESAAPATGDAERTLTPSAGPSPLASGSTEGAETTTPLETNTNASATPTPAPADAQAGDDAEGEGEEEEEPAATPQPTPTPRKAPTPPPPASGDDDPPPVRTPAPATPPEPRSSPPASAVERDEPAPKLPNP
ncbi:MAG TPA: protein kinase [Pyrinomonadaceae bacterium]|nr:protein kinase [Pyrinomonadaceae bacterium]